MAVHVQTQAHASGEQSGRIRLICLAGSHRQLAQYRLWANALNEPAELIAVDLPARSTWLDSIDPAQPYTRLACTLAEQLEPFLAQPHALFGQNAGAHVALALTALAQRAWPGHTRHLFVAGCDSPEVTPGGSEVAIQVPMTVLYPSGALASMLGWNHHAHRGLELIELAAHSADDALFNQRIVRIFNTHLGLLSF